MPFAAARQICRLMAFACALLGFLLLCSERPATADEPLTEKEYKKRRSALRTAGGRYITRRKKFPSRCPGCKGVGKRRQRHGRAYKWVQCPQCVGHGAWVSKKDFQAVYFDMRTPAFRAQPGIKEALGKQYDLARRGQPWPRLIKRYRLRHWELVDSTHGIVWFYYNADRSPTPTRWIYCASEGGGKPRWHFYDSRSDGPWPDDPTTTTPAGRQPTQPIERPDERNARLIRTAVGQARITFRVDQSGFSGGVLRLTLVPATDAEERIPEARVGLDAVKLARSVYAVGGPWTRLETVWHDQWKDAYGRTVLRPRWVSALSKADHDSAGWDTLSLAQQITRLTITELAFDGWEPVQRVPRAKETPAPTKPTAEPEAPPPTEEPAKPTPTNEPEKPAARPTPAPPPTAPVTEELPALTKKGKKAGDVGVTEMRRLLKLATEAFNEGQKAHKDGAHDLWQEKLGESLSHLGACHEVWNEDIVPAMPGRDPAEQDAVANEHYGEIWDDVSELESIVRKVTAIR